MAPTTVAHPWWVGHTKSRCEKAFVWDLFRAKVDYFLPFIERLKLAGGKKRRVFIPLFPSYVFFRGDLENRNFAVRTGRLCQVLPVVEQLRLAEELDAIQRALAAGALLDPYEFAAIGRRCRVAAGPLQGIEGKVVERDNGTRLVLEVRMLGRGASLEIDAELLEEAHSIESDTYAHP